MRGVDVEVYGWSQGSNDAGEKTPLYHLFVTDEDRFNRDLLAFVRN